MPTEDTSAGRKRGKVVRVLKTFGFISCSELPGQDIFFANSWVDEMAPLRVGEEVSFELQLDGEKPQARSVRKNGTSSNSPKNRLPQNSKMLDWAYFGHFPRILVQLKDLALQEDWEFKNTPPKPDHPLPILMSYLIHTFGRLVLEKKVLVNEEASLAAFNTGLVDPRYEPIYALFSPNTDIRAHWQLAGFCIAGEGPDGQKLVRFFSPLPQGAHYFDNPIDLLYDIRVGKPELDWRHVIIERIDRYPKSFIEDHWPSGFPRRDLSTILPGDRKIFFTDFGKAIQADSATYRRIMNRLKDAINLSLKRVSWNFKTAIPTYYPRVKQLQLLLPICLVSDDQVDLALTVEKTPSGSYLGHTVLPLDWAYKNARLICRPDSDWLAPDGIAGDVLDEEDSDG